MKKALLLIVASLLVFTVFLASCENENETASLNESKAEIDINFPEKDGSVAESKDSTEESSKTEQENESKEDKEESKNDSDDNQNGDCNIKVEACSFSEKPYFALVGTCDEGATVTGVANGETVTSKSYKGWFSLRLKCSGASVDVTLTQSIDGVQVGGELKYTAKPITPSADMWPVVTGGDFQFFFQKMLPDFQGKNLPSNLELSNLPIRTQNKVNQLKAANPDAELIYLLVPLAMSVYPELVPKAYAPASGKTKYDLIAERLTEGGATVIDLKGAFAEHKNDEMPLYYKLDSHWSDYGAFVAYTELFNHISKKFPDAAPRGIDEFNWNPDYYQSGDMTYYLQMSQSKIKEFSYYRTFKDSVPSSISSVKRHVSADKLTYSDAVTYENVINTNNSKLPNCIVMRDSYSTQIYDILAERTNTTHYYGMWNYTWDKNAIASEAPDYVIYIIAEWNLDAIK